MTEWGGGSHGAFPAHSARGEVLRRVHRRGRGAAAGGAAAHRDASAGTPGLGQGRRDQGGRAQVRLPDARHHPAAQPHLRDADRPRGHPRARLFGGQRDGRDRPLRRRRPPLPHRPRALRGPRPHPHHRGERGAAPRGARGARGPQGRLRRRARDQPPRARGRPRPPARGELALRGGARPDRRDQVEGDPRLPRGRHLSLPRRGQRPRRHRREARLRAVVDAQLGIVVALVLVALAFDFINGFHDAANSIATVVSTRVLSPGKAVVWAAFFNFAAALVFGTAVAKTVGSGMIDLQVVTFSVIFPRLVGAIAWDLLTWYYALPTSSSHALFGGYAGAAVAKAGFVAVIASGWTKTLVFMVVAPTIGLAVGLASMTSILWLFRHSTPTRVDRGFRRLQLCSAAAYSLMHGANDAQKTMGIITGALVTGGYLASFEVPIWVILAAHAAIGLGTLSGGWRIIHTMGNRITRLQPVSGFAAETGAAVAIYTASALGIGISTTHTITGAIIGVGSTRRLSAVRWGVAQRIVWAWIATLPGSAAIGALT